jgi:hypothetical protein
MAATEEGEKVLEPAKRVRLAGRGVACEETA